MEGYHAVNLLLHVVNTVLLVQLLLSSGIPRMGAILGGAMFLVHPAQVEAVVWVSQLKSVACMTFGLAALLSLQRLPQLSTLLFGLALLTKFAAVGFLPTAAVLASVRRMPRSSWIWLTAWLAVFAAVAAVQLSVFGSGSAYESSQVFAGACEQLRSIAAIGARYLWMAGTGMGLSAFHDPEPARSLLDRWWLAGLASGAVLAWRASVVVYRRREEAVYWVLAAASFLPVSQLVPFRYPMADRYLYFILPGLIGGSWLAAMAVCDWLGARRAGPAAGRVAWSGACVAAALLALHFGLLAVARVPLWLDGRHLLLDSAAHYPSGTFGYYVRAVQAAEGGDAETAVAELRVLEQRKRYSFMSDYEQDPYLAPLRDDPGFRELVRETARARIEWIRERGLWPHETATLALKHAVLGEYDVAIEMLEEELRREDDEHLREVLLAALGNIRSQRGAAHAATD